MTLTLEDKIELAELAGRYGDYADVRDWEKIKTVFAKDATFEFKGMAMLNNLTEIEAHFMRDNPAGPLGHFFTNIYSEASDTGAKLNFRSVFVMPGGNMKDGFTTFYGTYRIDTVKIENGWKFRNVIFYPANSLQKS